MEHSSSKDLFDYTSGRWMFNGALRRAERRRVFNVEGLCRLAAESVGRSPDDIVDFVKLAEGGFNCVFLITMRNDFQMVARIPYPVMVPKDFSVASEVATMDLLRSSGLPIPEVYGYSPVPENAVETEYIFMEFVRGTKLSEIWFELGESEISSVLRELTQLESKIMTIDFPAGGSLYYAQDLEKITGRPGIPLEDGRFCVGPDTSPHLWFGRRSQLDIDRGPYESVEAALVAGVHKERAYLERFGQPLLPLRRFRREAYQYQEQSPLDHIENLDRYLLIAPSLVPRNTALCHFRIRHPDIQPGNVIVSRSPGSNFQIISMLDWRFTSILPVFLLAGIPAFIQNYDDPISQAMTHPSLPDLDNLDEREHSRAMGLYARRLTHYHYLKNVKKYHELHCEAMTNLMSMIRCRLFYHSGEMWDGETLALKVALIYAMEPEKWKVLTGRDAPCPVVFDAQDIRETTKLQEVQAKSDKLLERFQNTIGFGEQGWAPNENYEAAVVVNERIKERFEEAETESDRDEIREHWILNNMPDEEKYM